MSLNFSKTIIVFISLITIIPILFSPVFSNDSTNTEVLNNSNIYINLNSKFPWPTPGYTRISSYFGKRNSPTKYASSFHKGIDIAAPAGTIIIASANSKVKYTGFYGSGGYTIILESGNLQFVYHHVSPDFLVSTGMYVYSGDIIGHVGPKNVYGIKNNPYKDSSRKSY